MVAETLNEIPVRAPGHFEELFLVDAEARERAAVAVERIGATLETGAGQ